MRKTFEDTLAEILRPEVEGLGFEFWGLTSPASGKKRVVRIYIDGPDGVTVDQCARISRQAALMLEVEDIIPGAFTLEVSSPGLERRFFTPEQMRAYLGKKIDVHLHEARDSRKKFKGELTGVEADTITLNVDNENFDFDWISVKEARLVHEF